MEKPKFTIPMFEKGKVQNSNVWKRQNSQFKCLEKEKFRIPMFGIPKIPNSNVWKSPH